jgi:hypothetical protein
MGETRRRSSLVYFYIAESLSFLLGVHLVLIAYCLRECMYLESFRGYVIVDDRPVSVSPHRLLCGTHSRDISVSRSFIIV